MIILDKYKNENLTVFGLGKTGLSVINCLLNSGAQVYAWDDSIERVLSASKTYKKCNFVHPREYNWKKLNALILSPGIPFLYPKSHWIVGLAQRSNCKITSDIELFFNACSAKQKIVGVTGTNGKSTTTALIGHILKSAGKRVEIGGNLGNPVLSLSSNAEVYVIELSSFQLELINKFSVDIAVLLNITRDHIDRHGNMKSYIDVKSKLVKNSKISVIGYDNLVTSKLLNKLHHSKILVSGKTVLNNGILFTNGNIYDCGQCILIGSARVNLTANAENITAAYAVCKLLNVEKSIIVRGIKSFSGLKHRSELLGKIGSVSFVNDSKATNAEASEKAITSYDKIYWIVGGKSKEGGIKALSKHFSKIKKAFLIGDSTELFANTLKNRVNFEKCDNLKNAFELSYKEALHENEEITILFSPACASFDQWKNFEERGEAFCSMFESLNNSLKMTESARNSLKVMELV